MHKDYLGILLIVLGCLCFAAAAFQLVGWVSLGINPSAQLAVGTIVFLMGVQRARLRQT